MNQQAFVRIPYVLILFAENIAHKIKFIVCIKIIGAYQSRIYANTSNRTHRTLSFSLCCALSCGSHQNYASTFKRLTPFTPHCTKTKPQKKMTQIIFMAFRLCVALIIFSLKTHSIISNNYLSFKAARRHSGLTGAGNVKANLFIRNIST